MTGIAMSAMVLVLTAYTFLYARSVWVRGEKFAGAAISMLALSLPVVSLWIGYTAK